MAALGLVLYFLQLLTEREGNQMSEKIIAFFSSDAREKYKADIFRVLALPKKSIIHFRYQPEFIMQYLFDDLEKIKKQRGVIFFASGNDLSKNREERIINSYSIREVRIKDVVFDKNLNLYNIYLVLEDFIDSLPITSVPKTSLPPYLSVSEIEVEFGDYNSWQDRVSLFKHDLVGTLFYFINSISDGKKQIEPRYSALDNESYYKLSDQSRYFLKISFYDPSNGDYGIRDEGIGEIVEINIPPGHRVGAPRDTNIFEVVTHSISSISAFNQSIIKVNNLPNNNENSLDLSVQLKWKIEKNLSSILLFGFFTLMATVGVGLATLATTDFETTKLTCINLGLGISSIFFVVIATTGLYWMFNKK